MMPTDRAEGAGAEPLADRQPRRRHLELARGHGRPLRRVKQRLRLRRAERRAQRVGGGADRGDAAQVGAHLVIRVRARVGVRVRGRGRVKVRFRVSSG